MSERLIEKETETRLYELAYLADPLLESEQLAQLTSKIKDIITEHQGVISQEQAPFKRGLSYKIRKQNEAFFGFLRFSINPEKVQNLRAALSLSGLLLRFLIVAVDHKQLQQEEQRQVHRPVSEGVKKLYRPRKEAPQEIKPDEFEKKLGEILGE